MPRHLYKLLALSALMLSCACGSMSPGGQDSYTSSIEAACSYVDINTLPAYVDLQVPYVKQAVNYCGPAAVTMIMEYYGYAADQYTIGADIVDEGGTTARELIEKSEDRGFVGSVVNCQLGGLLGLLAEGKPVITRILNDLGTGGHFVVVTGYDRTSNLIYLNDPDQPYRKAESFEEFSRLWNVKNLGEGSNSENMAIVLSPNVQLAQM
jgi:ABC-type bacteriocin/lantibiotic exporter with double-glycine peptidase domain